jgi:hypothetical protein
METGARCRSYLERRLRGRPATAQPRIYSYSAERALHGSDPIPACSPAGRRPGVITQSRDGRPRHRLHGSADPTPACFQMVGDMFFLRYGASMCLRACDW